MGMIYRIAAPPDEEQLFMLAASLATSHPVNKEAFSRIYQDLLSDTKADLFIAEEDSLIIGYVLVFHHSAFYANGVISRVEELFVSEAYRGRNIGKKLMAIVEEKALERGSKLVSLATRRAGGFYKSIGYEESAAYFKKTLFRD